MNINKSKMVIIKKENEEKIMSVFNEVQGKSTSRYIYNFKQLEKITNSVDERCNISKKALNGTKVNYDFREEFGSSYKYTPMSTHFTIVFDNNKWYIDLNSIKRDKTPNLKCEHCYQLILSDTAKDEILSKHFS